MSSHQTRPLRILCLDDEAAIRNVLLLHFRRAGHEAEAAADGLEGWDLLSTDLGRFDVVVTDFEMPGVGGLEFVQLLREANYAGKVIVFSSSLAPHHKESFRALGVDAIVEKGSSIGDLMTEVEAPAEKHSAKRAPQT